MTLELSGSPLDDPNGFEIFAAKRARHGPTDDYLTVCRLRWMHARTDNQPIFPLDEDEASIGGRKGRRRGHRRGSAQQQRKAAVARAESNRGEGGGGASGGGAAASLDDEASSSR